MSKQKLHYSDGKSNKFWLITLEGCTQTVSYGKVGTNGQTKTKEFTTAAEAKRSYEKLIQAKLKKGYNAAEASVTNPAQSTNAEEPIQQAETKTPAADDSVLATVRSESQPAITAVTITRSIELEPVFWLWATWRQHLPQQRPKRTPFNQQEALARLAKVPVRRYGWEWDWSEAQIVVSLSREEAHFWFTAMTEANRDINPLLSLSE